MATFRAICLDCRQFVEVEVETCPTCERPFANMSYLAEAAVNIDHPKLCPNREKAVVRKATRLQVHRIEFKGKDKW